MVPHTDCRSSSIQNIPDHLLLRKDQTPFRSCLVDGNHQYDPIQRSDQIPYQSLFSAVFLTQMSNALLQFLNACLLQGTDADACCRNRSVRICPQKFFFCIFIQQITFIPGDQIWNLFFSEQFQQLLIAGFQFFGTVCHKHCHIGPVEHLSGLPDPQFSQRSFVIKSWCVNNHHRSHRQQLHSLCHRIGRRATHIGHHRQILTGHCIDQTGFSCISPAKESNVDPFSGRSFIHPHPVSLLFIYLL